MKSDLLFNSLKNEENADILELTPSKISECKNNILQTLRFSREDLKKLHIQLKEYRYINEICEIKIGHYIRWINIKNPDNIFLNKGAHILDIKLLKSGCNILCKKFSNKIIQIKLDECIIFQKLSDQEKIILQAIKYLNT